MVSCKTFFRSEQVINNERWFARESYEFPPHIATPFSDEFLLSLKNRRKIFLGEKRRTL